jgi:hypothetical protein
MNISQDKRYLQCENLIVDLETGLRFNSNNPHPVFVCEMFKRQFVDSYKNKLMESKELFSKMKELIYPLIVHDRNLVSEYEVRYGMNMIFESKENFSYSTMRMIEESWDFVKLKMINQFPLIMEEEGWLDGVWNKTKEIAGNVVDKVKEGATWVLNKGLPWFFKKLESFLLSPVGIGVDVALTAIGIGKIATTIIWGALGAWKIYELMTGIIPNNAWSYLDIAICFVGLIFTGGAAKGLKATIKAAGRDLSKLGKGALKPIIDLISKGATFLSNAILKPLEWLLGIFGPKAQSIITVVKSNINKFFERLSNLIKPSSGGKSLTSRVIKKGVKSDIINPVKAAIKNPSVVAPALRKGAVAGLAFHGFGKGLEKGIESYGEYKQGQNKEDVEKIAKSFSDDQLKQSTSYDLSAAIEQMKQLDNK